ncbi:DNA (cytosine-5-)-methyltransferase [Eubacterium sp.]|uniref:DNA (cytosine-5-)-methyltransferase n=1 Tax=Eubacterium sp. TaxID=142586 RepID=UPI00352163A4
MDKTVCELFAGVGGFRCGLNSIKTLEDTKKTEKWKTVWFSQWEPDKKNQWAHACYVNRFGKSLDLNGIDTTNIDIARVDKNTIPNHNLLVGGFPCQDYSVARGLNGERGINGKKGVLWWSIRDVINTKKPPFILLENVDRLLKSPSKQRGRDFGVILACLNESGYSVEWRVINAAEYGFQQRRRRTYIFAYKDTTKYARKMKNHSFYDVIQKEGFFAKSFPIECFEEKKIRDREIPLDIVEVSDEFKFQFENSGYMRDGRAYTVKTIPVYKKPIPLGEILQDNITSLVDKKYYIDKEKLYYTYEDINHSDESHEELPKEHRQTWQYLKGGKKKLRTALTGHQYIFSEGPIPMVDEWDTPARTMLTSEGSFNRSTHIVRDKMTHEIRILTPIETERIQGFPDDWTKECLVDDEIVPMPERTRYFCMGNALVVNLVKQMEVELDEIFDNE